MSHISSKAHRSFAPVFIALAVLVLSGLACIGWRLRPAKRISQAPPLSVSQYAGWREVCDEQSAACFMRPPDWLASPYGGFQNPADTAYANLYIDSKDQAVDSASIVSLQYPQKGGQGVMIVGFIHGIVPGYALYDQSAVKDLRPGAQAQLVVANPTFTARSGLSDTFSATPGAAGISALTTFRQAQLWFTTPEAKSDLKIMQSFHYRE